MDYIYLGLIFLISTFLIYRLSYKHFRKNTSNKMWKQWGMKTPYWEGVVIVSFGITMILYSIIKTIG